MSDKPPKKEKVIKPKNSNDLNFLIGVGSGEKMKIKKLNWSSLNQLDCDDNDDGDINEWLIFSEIFQKKSAINWMFLTILKFRECFGI